MGPTERVPSCAVHSDGMISRKKDPASQPARPQPQFAESIRRIQSFHWTNQTAVFTFSADNDGGFRARAAVLRRAADRAHDCRVPLGDEEAEWARWVATSSSRNGRRAREPT